MWLRQLSRACVPDNKVAKTTLNDECARQQGSWGDSQWRVCKTARQLASHPKEDVPHKVVVWMGDVPNSKVAGMTLF